MEQGADQEMLEVTGVLEGKVKADRETPCARTQLCLQYVVHRIIDQEASIVGAALLVFHLCHDSQQHSGTVRQVYRY